MDALKTLYFQVLRGQISAADVAKFAVEHPQFFEFDVQRTTPGEDGVVEITLSAKGLYNTNHALTSAENEARITRAVRETLIPSRRLPAPVSSQLRVR